MDLEAEDGVEAGDGVVVVDEVDVVGRRGHRATSRTGASSRIGWPQRSSRAASSAPPDAVEAVVGQGGRHDLQPDRQPVLGRQPDGQRQAAVAGQVDRDRGHVVEVHRERVVELVPELEGRRRAGRRHEDVDPVEGGGEVTRDEGADLLRLAVVGVVVAGGQRVGAEDDAALHLVAEAGVTGGRHDLLGRVRAVVTDPEAVAHGVELREVRRRLARQDQVVGGQRVVEARAVHLLDRRAQRHEEVDGLGEALLHTGLVALAAELLDEAEAQATDVELPVQHRRGRAAVRRPTSSRAGRGRR